MLIECLCVPGGGEGFPPVGRVELAWNPCVRAFLLSFGWPGWTSDQVGYSRLEGRRCSRGGCKQGTLLREGLRVFLH